MSVKNIYLFLIKSCSKFCYKQNNNNKVEAKEHDNSRNTMKSIKFAIIILQIFGFMPLDGISSSNPDDLKFKWVSIKTLYAIWNVICASFIIIMGTIDSIELDHGFLQQFCKFSLK